MRLPRLPWLLISLLAASAAGCMAPGTSLLPEIHHLTSTTKSLVQPEPWPLPRELAKQPLPPYTVEPGDVLLLLVADLDSPVRLPGDQPVLPDGTIQLGRYGQLQVAGRTLEEIEVMVREAVAARTKDAGPVNVRLVNRQSKVYYVLGEVHAPGAFPLQGRETVLDGILAAGGLTDRASRTKIILSRPSEPHSCRLVLPVCYNEIVQQGDTTTNYQLAPGDRIFVSSHCFIDDVAAWFKKDGPCCTAPYRCPAPEGCAGEVAPPCITPVADAPGAPAITSSTPGP